jgi:hypothetical protein
MRATRGGEERTMGSPGQGKFGRAGSRCATRACGGRVAARLCWGRLSRRRGRALVPWCVAGLAMALWVARAPSCHRGRWQCRAQLSSGACPCTWACRPLNCNNGQGQPYMHNNVIALRPALPRCGTWPWKGAFRPATAVTPPKKESGQLTSAHAHPRTPAAAAARRCRGSRRRARRVLPCRAVPLRRRSRGR